MKLKIKPLKTNRTVPDAKLRRSRRHLACAIMMVMLIPCLLVPGFADEASNTATAALTNIADLIFSVVKVVGVIAALFGVLQFGMSMQSHDTSQRTQGLLGILAGVIIFFAKEILTAAGISL